MKKVFSILLCCVFIFGLSVSSALVEEIDIAEQEYEHTETVVVYIENFELQEETIVDEQVEETQFAEDYPFEEKQSLDADETTSMDKETRLAMIEADIKNNKDISIIPNEIFVQCTALPELTYNENGEVTEVYGIPIESISFSPFMAEFESGFFAETSYVVVVSEETDTKKVVDILNEKEEVVFAVNNLMISMDYDGEFEENAESDISSVNSNESALTDKELAKAKKAQLIAEVNESLAATEGIEYIPKEVIVLATELPKTEVGEEGNIISVYGIEVESVRPDLFVEDFINGVFDSITYVIILKDDSEVKSAIDILNAQDGVTLAIQNFYEPLSNLIDIRYTPLYVDGKIVDIQDLRDENT